MAIQLTALGYAAAWIPTRPAVGIGEVLFEVSTSPSSRTAGESRRATAGTGRTGRHVSLVALISLKPEVVRRVEVMVLRAVVVVATKVVVFVIPGTYAMYVSVRVCVVVDRLWKPSVKVDTTCVVCVLVMVVVGGMEMIDGVEVCLFRLLVKIDL